MRKYLLIAAITLAFPIFALAHGGVNDDELIIRMTKNGFEPKELTVVEGDEVLFINNDDVDRWPASNFHPTHTIYPEFDTRGHVKPGESWKFKFENTGTWRMHDHLIPHMTGTILVLKDETKSATSTEAKEKDGEDSKISTTGSLWGKIKSFLAKFFSTRTKSASAVDNSRLAEFKSLNESEKYDWLEATSSSDGPQTAWNYVLAAYSSPQGTLGSAHDMAHLVGQLIFNEHGLDGLPICTPVFAFGCYHGLMEVAFDGKDAPDYKKSILEAETSCEKLGDIENPAFWSCVHGAGHGIITYREHDTPKALDDCDLFVEQLRTYCYDGVFMELSISGTPSTYKKSDPLYPCNAIDEKYQTACARAQSRIMRSMFSMNTASIAKMCMDSTKTIRYHCVDSLGYYAAQMSQNSPVTIIRECETIANENDQAQCKAAAAGELVFQDAVGWKENSAKICKSMDSNYFTNCEERVSSVKKSYGRK